jgi:hypothetical protein
MMLGPEAYHRSISKDLYKPVSNPRRVDTKTEPKAINTGDSYTEHTKTVHGPMGTTPAVEPQKLTVCKATLSR